MIYHTDCKLFTGYKPCIHARPCGNCPKYQPVHTRVAILSLEALGAVLRSTCLLKPIRKKYPNAHITWITYPNAKSLLENNFEIDRLMTLDATTSGLVDFLKFDVLFAVDKSMEAGALAEKIQADEKYGFGLLPNGVIRPLTNHANYQYDVGLDNELKFRINQKPETQQLTESMDLEWVRDEYILDLSVDEKSIVAAKRKEILEGHGSAKMAKGIIGYNTGCSLLYPYKKFTIEYSIELIKMWRKNFPDFKIALLGGREDTERQAAMKLHFQDDPYVVNTLTTEGLRKGVLTMATSDIVLSGCSLGLHIAIALKKHTIAWFGVSCIQEVDVYDRGVKIQSDVTCSPCWKKSCQNEPKCFNRVDLEKVRHATQELLLRQNLC